MFRTHSAPPPPLETLNINLRKIQGILPQGPQQLLTIQLYEAFRQTIYKHIVSNSTQVPENHSHFTKVQILKISH